MSLLTNQIKTATLRLSYEYYGLTQEERNYRIAVINQLRFDFDVILESLQSIINYE